MKAKKIIGKNITDSFWVDTGGGYSKVVEIYYNKYVFPFQRLSSRFNSSKP